MHRYLQKTIFNFKFKFHLEDDLVEQRYFDPFFSAWSIFSSCKRWLLNAQRGRLQPFFYIAFAFLVKLTAPKSLIFFCGKYGTKAANINWWYFWMRNGGLLLPTFWTFYSSAIILTHSDCIHLSYMRRRSMREPTTSSASQSLVMMGWRSRAGCLR